MTPLTTVTPRLLTAAILLALTLASPAVAQVGSAAIPVTVAPEIGGVQAGRLLVFARKVDPAPAADKAPASAKAPDEVDTSPFHPEQVAVAGREVLALAPGETALVDGDTDTYPTAFSRLPPGSYQLQAVLDRNHDYNYRGRGEGDLVSPVVTATLPGGFPTLCLSRVVPAKTPEQMLAQLPPERRASVAEGLAAVQRVEFVSPALSRFWGRPVAIRGSVALPPGYGSDAATYPTVFSTGGFGSTLTSAGASAAMAWSGMKAGTLPPMIWVVLDESSPTGTHEFADSVNNGPWGEALTAEFLPWIEGRYRMDARAGSRFLTGHSSGGWATLWLQTRYPALFGGVWATAPDPSDFHDFTGIDLYAAGVTAYAGADGKPLPLVRDKGQVVATLGQFARLEAVLGGYGGQFASFDWVFSPKGADGRPQPLFDRASGRIDPAVAAYWRENYDIAARVARDWPLLKSDLDGKVHLIVGTADTFYLDGPAHRLQRVLDGLGARSSFTYVPGRSHFDLYARGNDRSALTKDIAWAMYAVARPGAKRPPSP